MSSAGIGRAWLAFARHFSFAKRFVRSPGFTFRQSARRVLNRSGLALTVEAVLRWGTARFPDVAQLNYMLGRALRLQASTDEAVVFLQHAVNLRPAVPRYARELVKTVRRQGRTWHEAEVLAQITAAQPGNANFHYRLGDAQKRMNRFADAAQAFAHANARKADSAWWHYREGYAWEQAGQCSRADAAYKRAVSLDQKLGAQELGVGAFHARRGLWEAAAHAFAQRLDERAAGGARVSSVAGDADARLCYHLGRAHEHCHRWRQAATCYSRALSLDGQQPEWLCRLGLVHERLGDWEAAATVYEQALNGNPDLSTTWRYRLGYALAEAGHFERACAAFQATYCRETGLDRLPAAADAHDEQAGACFREAVLAERRGDWCDAAIHYQHAVDRKNKHDPVWYYRLGHALARTGRFREASDAYRAMFIFRRPGIAPTPRQRRNAALMSTFEYTEFVETLAVCDRSILYESFLGASISCNPYALFKALSADQQFRGYRHVWVINDLAAVPPAMQGHANVVFVKKGSQLYRRYLAVSRYLINNSTFPYYFLRRDGQKYLNTWHGTPLKTLGKDIRGQFMEHKNTARNLLHATHVISPNSHTSDVLIGRHDLEGVFQGKLAQTGYPRVDLIVEAPDEERRQIRTRLGLPAVARRPLVLYAPTWRGILGKTRFDTRRLVQDLSQLVKGEYDFVFQGHHFVSEQLARTNLNVVVPPPDMDTSELLSVTDVLITDYSSIFFDFLPTRRPILFYTYDYDAYQRERGLYFDMQQMPGLCCATLEELMAALAAVVRDVDDGRWRPDEVYLQCLERFCPSEDGRATQRVIDFFFNDDSGCVATLSEDTRPGLLFYVGSFIPNGITTAALNLLAGIDPGRYRMVLAIDPGAISRDEKRLERFRRLAGHVQIIPRVGRLAADPQEQAIVDRFNRHYALSDGQWACLDNAFRREFKRIFARWVPSAAIQYEGYARYWVQLFAMGSAATGRVLYQHSDIYNEWTSRFPYFEAILKLASRYDHLVSVSSAVADTNRKNLASLFDLDPHRFVHADNVPDIDGVRKASLAPLDEDLAAFLSGAPREQIFVTMGRLSPEKNHALMLDSFAQVMQQYPQAKLVILGEGPLRSQLERQIEALGLNGSAWLAGLRENPFPVIAMGGCFVLSSAYEGQPMVLLEAMALGIPVISTDIPGPAELLRTCRYGERVPEDSAALAHAMIGIIASGGWQNNDDALSIEQYRRSTLEQFYRLLEYRPVRQIACTARHGARNRNC